MPEALEIDEIALVRLKRRSEYVFVRHGQSERRRTVVVQARRRKGHTHIGIGFTATKKVGGAVVRNRAKRRLRSAARCLMPVHGVAGTDYVFIARKDTAEVAWQRLLDDMESALISLASSLSDGAAKA
ncbi:MAG: ribonuclease P protein component [Pseudomonadota bacterium]